MGERDRELETIKCPVCGANTRTKVKKDTALVFFPLYCQKCKKELTRRVYVHHTDEMRGQSIKIINTMYM